MQFVPHTPQEWSKFALLPFKAYVVIAFLMAMFCSKGLRADTTILFLILGYVLSFFVLLFAALAQFVSGRRETAFASLVFAGLAFVFGWQLLPYLAS